MSNETSQETWNATHAQLLKSVADAQARLLAAQNETNDRLERMDRDLRVLIGQTQEALRDSHGDLSGKLDSVQRGIYLHIDQHADAILARVVDVIEAKLAAPRRQVEKLRPKRIVKRAVERKR